MIYKGMEYALPITALTKKLTYIVQLRQQLLINGKENKMLIEFTCVIQADVEPRQYLVSFEDLRINGHAEGDYEKPEWLFARLFDINRNLIIKTDQYGSIIGVGDKKNILSAWELARADINAVYERGEISALINSMDNSLNNEMKILYHHDQLLNLLFNNIYQTYVGGNTIATEKIILKHFGTTALPIIEYKELVLMDERSNLAVIEVSGQISELFSDHEGMNNYLAEITGQESDQAMDYYFDYAGRYEVSIGAEHYIVQAELSISGECEGCKIQTDYYLKLQL